MAQRHNPSADHFDLLPFIAIMMCVLGCLLLVTMSVAALSIGPNVGEGWAPTMDCASPGKTPVLIEWDGSNAIFHQDDGGKKQIAVTIDQSDDNLSTQLEKRNRGELKQALDDLAAKTETHYALFAVRPSGFSNFLRFLALFRQRKISVGYEPIKQGKPVRLLLPKCAPR